MKTDNNTTLNLYRCPDGTFAYAMFTADGFDHSDTLDGDSAAEARAELLARWPDATITEIAYSEAYAAR